MTDNSEKIRFWINEEAFFTEPGTTVSSLLKKSHGVEMPCGGRHACGKCMVYAEGGFAAPSETEQKLLGAERLAQGIRLACFLKAVPDGKIDALRQEADGEETICVSTPSAPTVAHAAGMLPAQPSEHTSAAPSAEAAPGARRLRSRAHVESLWGTAFALLDLREAVLSGMRDLMLLQRR